MKIRIKQVQKLIGLPLPAYATQGSAGVDLYAAISTPFIIKPLDRVLVPSGIAIALPFGYEAQIRSRSGLAKNFGIIVLNAPGTIDSDYRGELQMPIVNLGKQDFQIEPAMRIAQLVISRYEIVNWELVDDLDSTTRGTKGFGSTGYQ